MAQWKTSTSTEEHSLLDVIFQGRHRRGCARAPAAGAGAGRAACCAEAAAALATTRLAALANHNQTAASAVSEGRDERPLTGLWQIDLYDKLQSKCRRQAMLNVFGSSPELGCVHRSPPYRTWPGMRPARRSTQGGLHTENGADGRQALAAYVKP